MVNAIFCAKKSAFIMHHLSIVIKRRASPLHGAQTKLQLNFKAARLAGAGLLIFINP